MQNKSFTIICSEFDLLINQLDEIISKKYEEDYYSHQITKDVYALHFEKYYFRNNSNLMMTVILNRLDNQTIEIKIISGGGKQGLIKDDFFAESSSINKFIKYFTKILDKNNWNFIGIGNTDS